MVPGRACWQGATATATAVQRMKKSCLSTTACRGGPARKIRSLTSQPASSRPRPQRRAVGSAQAFQQEHWTARRAGGARACEGNGVGAYVELDRHLVAAEHPATKASCKCNRKRGGGTRPERGEQPSPPRARTIPAATSHNRSPPSTNARVQRGGCRRPSLQRFPHVMLWLGWEDVGDASEFGVGPPMWQTAAPAALAVRSLIGKSRI